MIRLNSFLLVTGSLTGIFLAACDEQTAKQIPKGGSNPPLFWERYRPLGVEFTHESGDTTNCLLPQILGAGCIVADLDNDLDNDLYFLQGHDLHQENANHPGNALYWNNGEGNFELAPDTCGASDAGFGISASVADIDLDGDLDIYICNLGPNTLLLNNGDRTFQSVQDAGGAMDDGFSTGSTFFDSDQDGDLDLYVTRYVDWNMEIEFECVNLLGGADFCPPGKYNRPLEDRFFLNESGMFVDQTEASGISMHRGHGLACAAGDVNSDGWDDLYVANDQTHNFLWINNGDNTFSEQASVLGCATSNTGEARAGMSVNLIDFDCDLDFDIHVSNLEGESDGLFINQNGQFIDQSSTSRLAGKCRKMTRWGTAFGDWNLDGQLEMYTACGRVLQTSQSSPDSPYGEADLYLELSQQTGRFESLDSNKAPTNARAVVAADLDGDLFPELVITQAWGEPIFLRRKAPVNKSFAVIEVLQQGLPAIGATIDVYLNSGVVNRYSIRTDGGYASASPASIMCANPQAISEIQILWPDRQKDVIKGPLPVGLTQFTKLKKVGR